MISERQIDRRAKSFQAQGTETVRPGKDWQEGYRIRVSGEWNGNFIYVALSITHKLNVP